LGFSAICRLQGVTDVTQLALSPNKWSVPLAFHYPDRTEIRVTTLRRLD
jgi:hypothetical protein